MDDTTHPFFVEDGDSRQNTAILLLAAAEQAGLDTRSVAAVNGGYRISQELSDALGAPETTPEPEVAPEPEATPEKDEAAQAKPTKKASGNRAAKNADPEQKKE